MLHRMKALAGRRQVQILAVDQKVRRVATFQLMSAGGGEQFVEIDQRVGRVDLEEERLVLLDELGEVLFGDAGELSELHLKGGQKAADEADYVRSQRVVDELLNFHLKLVDRTGRALWGRFELVWVI